jgi:arginyl-tRNA--protein-N-Asp/Glu arginylyltransferase
MSPEVQLFSHYPAIAAPVNVKLHVLAEHPCGYFPQRSAQMRAFWVEKMPEEMYHAFMNAGFRRSGRVLYQPICSGCRRCVPIRIVVAGFEPSKSQRRCLRQNNDLVVTASEPKLTDEKFSLYCKYTKARHGGKEETRQAFESFLYDSPVKTLEFTYRDAGGSLLAVGICDVCHDSLSSVYFYFEPSQRRRSLGTYGLLREIDHARTEKIPFYYLGYWVQGCRSMEYKSEFGPSELLRTDGVWKQVDEVNPLEHDS